MNKSLDFNENYKLTDVIKENDEIIADVNSFVNEIEKSVNLCQKDLNNLLITGNELLLDLDDIIGCIENCQKINDPSLKSFDSNKKLCKSKAQKAKKQLVDAISKLNKSQAKHLENINMKDKESLISESKNVELSQTKNIMNKNENVEQNIKSKKRLEEDTIPVNTTTENDSNEIFHENGEINNEETKKNPNKTKGESSVVKTKGILKSRGLKNKQKLPLKIDKNEDNSFEINPVDEVIPNSLLPLSDETNSFDERSLNTQESDIINNKRKIKKLNLENTISEEKIQSEVKLNLKNKKKKIEKLRNKDIDISERKNIKNVVNLEKDQFSISHPTEQIELISTSTEVKPKNNGDNSNDDDNVSISSTENKSSIIKSSARLHNNKNETFNDKEGVFIKEDKNITGFQNDEGTTKWNQLKQSMEEKNGTKSFKSIGDFPAGFCYSTLFNWSQENPLTTGSRGYFYPNLTESNLCYSDSQLRLNRPQNIKILCQIQIIKAVHTPKTFDKFIILSRHIRMCLFDGNKPLSNIHVIRATVTEKDMNTWCFISKIANMTKSEEFNDIFVKFNEASRDISLLMEFCITGYYKEIVSSNIKSDPKGDQKFDDHELVELSIGWTMIPLCESNGQVISNKKGDYTIIGGSPSERGVEIDSDPSRTNPTGTKFGFNQNKISRITVRIYSPNKENKDILETLPNIFIGSSLNMVIFSFYYRILKEEISGCRLNLTSTKPIFSPFLVSFMESVASPEIMDFLRVIWNETSKTLKLTNKKDYGKMNELFKFVYLDYSYPLTKLNCSYVTELGQPYYEKILPNSCDQFMKQIKQNNLEVLLTDEYSFAPFTFKELDFNSLSIYSKK